ncbi:MAG TPA: hypothetical protein VL172_01295 [Kofleriaceae bacterium]|nr:hypothetical protein [Kofleriaceae bacterium]
MFVGDDGTVVPVVLQRRGDGQAEAKGWIGRGGRWQARLYHRYRMTAGDADSPERAVAALARAPGTPVRGRLDRAGARFDLELRLPGALLRIEAPSLQLLGATDDPEGESIYRAGRAELTAGARRLPGWLVAEETPARRPRRALVDYGDFSFTVAAEPERVAVAKRSRTRPGFDQRLGLPSAPARDPIDDAAVLARDTTRGTGPDGRPVRYEVLLLGGAVHGVAFTIRPDNQE